MPHACLASQHDRIFGAKSLCNTAAGAMDVALVTLPVPANRALSTTRLLSNPLLALLPDVLVLWTPRCRRPGSARCR